MKLGKKTSQSLVPSFELDAKHPEGTAWQSSETWTAWTGPLLPFTDTHCAPFAILTPLRKLDLG